MEICGGSRWGAERAFLLCVCPKSFVMRTVFFHQSGQSPKVLRAKPVGLERTDSQTIGEFSRRRKGR